MYIGDIGGFNRNESNLVEEGTGSVGGGLRVGGGGEVQYCGPVGYKSLSTASRVVQASVGYWYTKHP